MVLTSAGAAGGAHVISASGPTVVAAQAEEDDGPGDTLPLPPTSTTPPPSTTTTASTTTTSVPEDEASELPSCAGDPVISENDPLEDWATIVLDPVHGIPADFEPPDIVEVDPSDVPGEIWIRELVVEDLTALLEDADEDDAPLTLVSGYRTYEYQESLYDEELEADGADASETTARPGHSEHQLGTTVDLLTPGMDELSSDFGDTDAGQWLSEHAPDYGFVVSYPAGAQDTTCYDYEPWHIRYVGHEIAGEIRDSGLSPREWMARHAAEGD